MGFWGVEFVIFVVILFVFSFIVVNYIYVENNFFFLCLNNFKVIWCLWICIFVMVIGGILLSFLLMW